ncbi:MAG: hypothetical protein IRZ08_10785 [Frankia sp.]|nr:hypothetical protein [Frankia sp.]
MRGPMIVEVTAGCAWVKASASSMSQSEEGSVLGRAVANNSPPSASDASPPFVTSTSSVPAAST